MASIPKSDLGAIEFNCKSAYKLPAVIGTRKVPDAAYSVLGRGQIGEDSPPCPLPVMFQLGILIAKGCKDFYKPPRWRVEFFDPPPFVGGF